MPWQQKLREVEIMCQGDNNEVLASEADLDDYLQKLREAWTCPACRFYRRGGIVLAMLLLMSKWFAG